MTNYKKRAEQDIDKLLILKQDHNRFKAILTECEELRWQKLNDYGKTYNEYGYIGILVKLGDKYGRLKNLYLKAQKGEQPHFETSRDSLIDLVNYAAMAIMEVDGHETDKSS